MAKIRLKVGVSGEDFSWRPGQEIDLPDDEAAKWADGERAEYVDGPPARETTSQPQPPTDAPPRPGGDTETTEEPPARETTSPPAAPDDAEPPAGNASRDEWAAYVVDVLKVDPVEIEGLGRNELRDRYGAPMDTEA